MNETDALDLVQSAVWTVIVASGPAIGVAMVVGVIIALFQALTQVQEMTLTFIPKIVIIFVMIALTAPGASFVHAPRVHIEVGRPGSDHDAVEHCPASGTLVPVAATSPSRTISVADAIADINAVLPSAGASPC